MTVGSRQENALPLPQHFWSLEVPQDLAARDCCNLQGTAPISILRYASILQVHLRQTFS